MRPMSANDFEVLYRELKKGALDPVYYLHGDEDLLKNEAVRDLVEAGVDVATRDFNLDRRRAPELVAEDFHALVHTPPMMAARRGVVVTEVEFLLQKKPKAQALRAAVLEYTARPFPETLLILVQSAGEKADPALVRAARTLAMEPLAPNRVAGWIRREAMKTGVSLDDGAIAHLQATIGSNLPVLASELAKLGAAVGARAATATGMRPAGGRGLTTAPSRLTNSPRRLKRSPRQSARTASRVSSSQRKRSHTIGNGSPKARSTECPPIEIRNRKRPPKR